jgi:hypothetical protein
MKCKCAKEIWLYFEATEKEKRKLDQHILACAECSVLLQQLKIQQQVVKSISSEIKHDNPDWITAKIMNKLDKIPVPAMRQGFSVPGLFVLPATRYAMSILSLILLLLLGFEVTRPAKINPASSRISATNPEKPAKLDSKVFLEKVDAKQPETKVSRMLQDYNSWKKCIAEKQDCSKEFKKNLKRLNQNEDI